MNSQYEKREKELDKMIVDKNMTEIFAKIDG